MAYFSDGENASFFAPAIENTTHLIVPAICIYEVFKRLLILGDEHIALVHIGDMHQGQIADLTAPIAIEAAKLSVELKIAMADSIILAIARANNATLWTQDVDVKGIGGVEYVAKNG